MRRIRTDAAAPLRALAALVLLALAGCAGRATAEGGAEAAAVPAGHAMVRVQNNAIPPTTLTVWAVPATGVRQMLGTMGPSETRTFHFRPTGPATRYRLVGVTTAGGEIVSREFTLGGTEGVVWDVNLNAVSPIPT